MGCEVFVDVCEEVFDVGVGVEVEECVEWVED